jgi:hypothetical protein
MMMFKDKYVFIATDEFCAHGVITDENQHGMILIKLDCSCCGNPREDQILLNTSLYHYYGNNDDMQYMLFFDTREELDAHIEWIETPSEEQDDEPADASHALH